MAHIIADRVKEASATTGTGVFTLTGAVLGARTFSSAMSNNDTCYYCIDDDGGNWELGLGTYNTNTLARTSVIKSSNANSLVDFPAGAKAVFITNPAINTPLITTGTFTPGAFGLTSAGAATYTAQIGTYTKQGALVYFNCELAWSAHTGTGALYVSGLPFTSAHSSVVNIAMATATFSGTPTAIVDSGATTIKLYTFASGGALTGLAMDTTMTVYLSGVYKAV